MRLKSASPEENQALIAIQAISILYDFHGSDIASAFGLAQGFSKPIEARSELQSFTQEIITARDTLLANQKLTLILRSKYASVPTLKASGLVDVLIKDGQEKRDRWLSSRAILKSDAHAGTVTVPGAGGRTIRAAVEDV